VYSGLAPYLFWRLKMKSVLIAVAVASGVMTFPAWADSVSVSVGEPGFYGRLDIGGYPQPQVIYAQPVVVEQDVPMDQPPIYLRVPPQQTRNWGHYCHRYNACGQRVMFVRDDWYRRQYAPNYRQQHHPHDVGDNGRGNDHRQDPGQHQHRPQQWPQQP
jgi:hypothetical protein